MSAIELATKKLPPPMSRTSLVQSGGILFEEVLQQTPAVYFIPELIFSELEFWKNRHFFPELERK
jgi:hypothetical protein